MNHFEVYKSYLEKQQIHLEEWQGDNYYFFGSNEQLKCGHTVRVVVGFDIKNTRAEVIILNYVNINNPSKREYIYQLLNELNGKYTFPKFFLDNEGKIMISTNLPIINNTFTPEVIDLIIFVLLEACDTEYSRFMKILW